MTANYTQLPAELRYAVVDLLEHHDAQHLAYTSRDSYALCIPALFKNVTLRSQESLRAFLAHVPKSYGRHTRTLAICTSAADGALSAPNTTEALAELLGRCALLEKLDLKLASSLRPSIIPAFQTLHVLRELAVSNCGDENLYPLSERLVVSIAASVPKLYRLTLDRIARSALHAPELVGCPSFVPVCTGDDDVPAHPVFGQDLSLPTLLRLPSLRYLRIRDTHLGDAAWATTPIQSPIAVLDLGSCYFETPEFNRRCTERIIGQIGDTVDEFSVNTPLSLDTYDFQKPVSTPLKRLRKVHLTPLLPVENVVDTLTTLSGSPVEELSVSCHEDDIEDMCEALKDFLSIQGALYPRLTEISLKTVGDDLESVKDTMKFPVASEVPVTFGAADASQNPALRTSAAACPQAALAAPLPRLARSMRDM